MDWWQWGLGIVGAILAAVAWPITSRWLDRPRVRIFVRRSGFGGIQGNPDELVFEAANGGRTPAALHPVVTASALELNMGRRFWFPGWLISEETARRWLITVPLERQGSRVVVHFDLAEGQDLQLPAHCDARSFRAVPSRDLRHPFFASLRYEFRLEGRLRPIVVRLPLVYDRQVAALPFWWHGVRRAIGWFPRIRDGKAIDDYRSRERARGPRPMARRWPLVLVLGLMALGAAVLALFAGWGSP
jgi:hypothetical protein